MTPSEFMTVFPIEKRYDGDRYEVKDYHYTMAELRKIGLNKPIGEHAQELLFDYQNRHVKKFNLFKMTIADHLRAYQGQPSMIEEFMAEIGVTPMRNDDR